DSPVQTQEGRRRPSQREDLREHEGPLWRRVEGRVPPAEAGEEEDGRRRGQRRRRERHTSTGEEPSTTQSDPGFREGCPDHQRPLWRETGRPGLTARGNQGGGAGFSREERR